MKRNTKDAVDESSAEQQFRKLNMISFVVWKIRSHTPSASGSYDRLAGWQSNEILVDTTIFEILYRLHHWDFHRGTVLL